MKPPLVSLLTLFLSALAVTMAPAAAAEKGPSFDCGKAATDVEKAICDDRDLSRLDRDLGAYYQAALKMLVAKPQIRKEVADAQLAWIRKRDETCRLPVGHTRKTVPLLPCLRNTYEERLMALARTVYANLEDEKKPAYISGWYRARQPGIAGRFMVLVWPDGRITGGIQTVRTNQGSHTCALEMPAMTRQENLLTHVDRDGQAKGCKLTIEIVNGKAVVRADQCLRQYWCGAAGFMSGRYELEK